MRTTQDQIYKIVDARLKRICASQYKSAMGKRKTRPKNGIQYSGLVTDLVSYLSELCECDNKRAEEIYSIVTYGEVDEEFSKAIKNGC